MEITGYIITIFVTFILSALLFKTENGLCHVLGAILAYGVISLVDQLLQITGVI